MTKYRKIMKTVLLSGAALGGLAMGQVDGELIDYHPNTVIAYAQDTLAEIKDILINRVTNSSLLDDGVKDAFMARINHLSDEESVLSLVKELEVDEVSAQIQALDLSDDVKADLLNSLSHLTTPQDVLSQAQALVDQVKTEVDNTVETSAVDSDEKVAQSSHTELTTPTPSTNQSVEADGWVDLSSHTKEETVVSTPLNEATSEQSITNEGQGAVEDKEVVEQTHEEEVVEMDQLMDQISIEVEGDEVTESEATHLDEVEDDYLDLTHDSVDETVVDEDKKEDYYTLTVEATAYSRNQPELSNHTFTGIDLREQSNVIAVDPSVIPLGSIVEIPGYGTFVAGDTGSAIIGGRIDIHMEDLQSAIAFGRQSVDIKVYENGASNTSSEQNHKVESAELGSLETVNHDESTDDLHIVDLSSEVVDEWIINEEDHVQDNVHPTTTPSETETVSAMDAIDAPIDSTESTEDEDVELEIVEIPQLDEELVHVEDIDFNDFIEVVDEVVEEIVEEVEEFIPEVVIEEGVAEEVTHSHTVTDIAGQYIGTPYVWGGSDESGFDCSGLTSYSYHQAGIDLPRTAEAQSTVGSHVELSDVQPGDLVFWGDVGSAYHVGIYTGDGQYIHAPDEGSSVQYGDLSYSGASFARRP